MGTRDTRRSFAERAADLVSRMTLSEKVAQLHTNSAPAIPRLGVQQYTYWSEGQHGVNALYGNLHHGGVTGGVHATSFPTNFAATMSWDPTLIHDEATAISDEARGFLDTSLFGTGQNNLGPARDDYGYLTYWAPTVNLDRDPRWGRTDEAFGEDPYLVSVMAGAFVDGYQGQTLDGRPTSRYLKVAATAKHYALNNVEHDRKAVSSNTSETNLREYYLAPFESLIGDAHVAGLMTSYNAVNGTPSVANTYTTDVLARRTYGFRGYTTSDCGAVGTTYRNPPAGHGWAPPGWTSDHRGGNPTWTNDATGQRVSGAAGGQAYALRAGTELNCTGTEYTLPNIEEAIHAGILDEGVLDSALVRLFTIRMATGEFDPPRKIPYTRITRDVIQSPAHQALAREVAANSVVLLKNDDVPGTDRPLLPADATTVRTVVVLGDLANTVTLGGYSGDPSLRVDAVRGVTAAVRATDPDASVVFDAAGTSTTATDPAVLSERVKADIRDAGLVLVMVGTDEHVAREGHDRAGLAMPGNYDSLIEQTTALGNPRTVLVIQSGGPVTIDDVRDRFPAIVFSGYNGESQGGALADVLFGDRNPSGHLNFTWYSDDSQLPDLSNYGLAPGETGGLGRTYRYFTGTPTYPFGYGLSYTTFRYSHVRADAGSVSADGTVRVGFEVTNTGRRPGADVAQLYVATPFTVPGRELPTQRLVGFRKTRVLKPGASQRISLPVEIADLGFWDEQRLRSVVHNGQYLFRVGPNSRDIAGTVAVDVHGTRTPRTKYVTVRPGRVVFRPGDTLDLTARNPWLADDTDPTSRQPRPRADHIVEAAADDGSFVDLRHADVRYRSGNRHVVAVSRTGLLTAVAAGVTTIHVTVDGVSGDAVVVVRQPFSTNAPPIVTPGSDVTATTTLPNTGDQPLKRVTTTLEVPRGWTTTAISPVSFARVPGGHTARTTWRVAVPADVRPGSGPLSATATFRGANGRDGVTGSVRVSVPHPSFAAAFDNPGISDDAHPSAGDIDGGGYSYSAQALSAVGLFPGATVRHDGLSFTWPDTAPGTPDNIVAGGQTVPFSGSGRTLGFLGTADYGAASGTGTITYTDGGTQPFTLGFANWWADAAVPGGDILATVPYLNTAEGRLNHTVRVYYAAVPLRADRMVRFVTLPAVSQGVSAGRTAMHVFAISAG